MSLGGETVKASALKFGMALIGFVGTIVFARHLGSSAIGGYYLLITAVKLSNRPINGLAEAVQKRASEAESNINELVTASVAFTVVWTFFLTTIAFVFAEFLASFTEMDNAWIAFSTLLATLSFFVVFQDTVAAFGEIGRSRWYDTVRSYLTFPVQILLLFGAGLGNAALVYGEVVATSVILVVIFVFAIPTTLVRPSRGTLRSLWSYAKYSIPNTYLNQMYSQLDTVLLGILVTQSAVGDYGVAFRLTVPATFISMVASLGMFSKVSNLDSKGEEIAGDIQNTLTYSSVIAIPMMAGGVILAEPLVVTVFGTEYVSAAPLLIGLLAYQLLRTQTQPLERVANGLDKPEVVTSVSTGLLTVNVILGVLLTLEYGAIGVVVATVIAELFRYGWLRRFVRSEVQFINFLPRPMVEQFVSAAVMAAAVLALQEGIAITSWLRLSVVLSGGALVYFVTLVGVSSMFRHTVRDIASVLYEDFLGSR